MSKSGRVKYIHERIVQNLELAIRQALLQRTVHVPRGQTVC